VNTIHSFASEAERVSFFISLDARFVNRLNSSWPYDGLLPEVVKQRTRPKYATAHAAQVYAGVRDTQREYVVSIDPAVSRNKRFRNALRASQVVSPNAVGQTITGLIYQFYGLRLRAEPDEEGNRLDAFFLSCIHHGSHLCRFIASIADPDLAHTFHRPLRLQRPKNNFR
jgi:hypothetical protein